MINWVDKHTETINGALVSMKIGIPEPEFWARWRSESKTELVAQGYKVFFNMELGKKKWYVKFPETLISKPLDKSLHLKDIHIDKLLDYQQPHFNKLLKAFCNGHGVVDGSDTGTGKTIVNLAVVKQLKLRPVIICPLAVIPTWFKWVKYIGVKPLFIANYEVFRGKGNEYGYMDKRVFPYKIIQVFTKIKNSGVKSFKNTNYTRTWYEALKILKVNGYPKINEMIVKYEELTNKKFPKKSCIEKHEFHWNLPKDAILIFDEVHKCKGPYTQNAEMLIAAKNHKILMLSATLAESPRDFRAIGYLLGHHELYNFNTWTRKFSCFQNQWNGWECTDPIGAMKKISETVFPLHGSRMRISEIPDFPESQITAECYESDIKEDVNKEYEILLNRIDELEVSGATAVDVFAEITRFRQATELMKIPLYISLVKDAIENGHSVPIFVNYTETRIALMKALKCPYAIYGNQHPQEREKNIDLFQKGIIRMLILNGEAGGTGISLHDVYGNYPRMSIISPTYNSRTFKQILGRPHRSGSKSKSLQRVVYLAGTIEEKICSKVNKKLDNINAMNDGDLMESDTLNLKKKVA